ncbi:MAG: hypothetical protein PUJ42_01010 [Bacteroidales bacterium]|nr:hypothetical protein [Bacteroidales bacterium]
MKKKYIKPEFEVISSDLRATVMIGSGLDHAEAKRRQMEEMEAALMEEEEEGPEWGKIDYNLWDDRP